MKPKNTKFQAWQLRWITTVADLFNHHPNPNPALFFIPKWLLHLDDPHVFRRVLDSKRYRFRATGFDWAKPTNPISDPPDPNPKSPPTPTLLPTKSTATTWFLFFKYPQLFESQTYPNEASRFPSKTNEALQRGQAATLGQMRR
ncbi:hypothetical protein CFP56_019045 [Quercus suber]|uniref:Uncharacterized protein n=1 Tax=Quercus suber TaxID=58331 RepID=A0AAW0KHF3_QUESU